MATDAEVEAVVAEGDPMKEAAEVVEAEVKAEAGDERVEALHPLALPAAGFHMNSGSPCQKRNEK
jgi:hypothetical protein